VVLEGPNNDRLWPRAGNWLVPELGGLRERRDLAVLGVPAHLTSISASNAHETPDAVRDALLRYSTFATSAGVDLASLSAVDLANVPDPDGPEGERRVRAEVERARDRQDLLIALGGDNSITYPVVLGLLGPDLAGCGLVTVDAHHDLRDGESNGSPIRRLMEAGLPGANIVQVGIADFSNSAAYSARARDARITVIDRARVAAEGPETVVRDALSIAGAGGRPVFVDLDVDVCDRAFVPACPGAAPGGISGYELRRMAFLFSADPRVRGMDVTEVDAAADTPDGRTVRLAALLVLEAAAGLATRGARPLPDEGSDVG
jgi:formiminoglutamase